MKTTRVKLKQLSDSDLKRFHAKYTKGPKEKCWLWTASCNSAGYGRFWFQGIRPAAHRISWFLVYGRIPNGKLLRHKCDVKLCVNPNHLETGTDRDNYLDRERTGNMGLGEQAWSAKLTEKQVLQLRKMAGTNLAISENFKISKSQVSRIKNRKQWKHI